MRIRSEVPNTVRLTLVVAGLCSAVNLFGAAPPVILNHPADQLVFFGTPVTLSITASNPSPTVMTFQWRRNGVNIPGAVSNYVATVATDTYFIQGVTPGDCGNYGAVVFNSDGPVNSTNARVLLEDLLPLPVEDLFDLRGQLPPTQSGSGLGANFDATTETGEPSHGGKRGGASIWYLWVAPTEGIATFDTRGSFFDTTLGAYEGEFLNALLPLDGDDDDGGFLNSTVSFNVQAGKGYNIAVDGYYGAKEKFILNWNVDPTGDRLPVIVSQPKGQVVPPGTNASFSVVVQAGIQVSYQWYRNGNPISGADTSSLVVNNVLPPDTGTYRVRVRAHQQQDRDVFSKGATLQINPSSTGTGAKAVAMRKFQEAVDPTTGPDLPALQPGGSDPRHALAGGYSGTQIFNTYGSTKEPGEPNHCNEAGGASYWYSYRAPVGGTLTVNTVGTVFNNVLAIYTGSATSFETLTPVTCSSTNVVPGGEAVSFTVSSTQTNYIVVDGVNGTSGIVVINYNLAAAPTITVPPQSRTVALGSNVTLTATAAGTPSLGYRWRSNGVFIPNRTTASLLLTNFKASYEAGYDLVVTNNVGAATSSVAWLYLNTPLRFSNTAYRPVNLFTTQLLGKANTNYVLQASTNLFSNWVSLSTNSSAFGIISYTNTLTPSFSNRYFRAYSQ